MTNEELYKEAKESYLKNKDKHLNLDEADYTEGYLDCVETQKKRIEELEAQIEKMKCLLNEIYSEFGFSELVRIRNDLPLEVQDVIKEIKEK